MIKVTDEADGLRQLHTECPACQVRGSGMFFRANAEGEAAMKTYLRDFFVALPGGDYACSTRCAGHMKNEQAPFAVSGEEAFKRMATKEAAPKIIGLEERERAERAANPDVRIRCARCAETKALAASTAAQGLEALGWHALAGGRWACSRTCLEWLQYAARTAPAVPATAPATSATLAAAARSDAVTRANVEQRTSTATLERRGG